MRFWFQEFGCSLFSVVLVVFQFLAETIAIGGLKYWTVLDKTKFGTENLAANRKQRNWYDWCIFYDCHWLSMYILLYSLTLAYHHLIVITWSAEKRIAVDEWICSLVEHSCKKNHRIIVASKVSKGSPTRPLLLTSISNFTACRLWMNLK